MYKISLLLISLLLTSHLLAEDTHEHHDHDEEDHTFEEHTSHVHGHATAQISLDHGVLNINKSLSSIDVFGFEHAPKNDEQKNKISQAIKVMQKIENIFVFNNNACELESVNIESEFKETDNGAHNDHDAHEDHHDHENENEHGHEDEVEEDSHSDVVANYMFKCDHEGLESIEYVIFDHFPSLEEIEVQFISEDKQSLFHATPKDRIQNLN